MKYLLVLISIFLLPQITNAKLPKKHELVGTWEIIKIQITRGLQKAEKNKAKELIQERTYSTITLKMDNSVVFQTADSIQNGYWLTQSDYQYYFDASANRTRRKPAIRLMIYKNDGDELFNGLIGHISRKADKFGYYNSECKYHLLKIEKMNN